jgi:hypothetical protein
MMETKLRELLELMDRPSKDVVPARIVAAIAELQAMAEEDEDVDPACFALLPREARVAGFQLMLAIMLGTVTG